MRLRRRCTGWFSPVVQAAKWEGSDTQPMPYLLPVHATWGIIEKKHRLCQTRKMVSSGPKIRS